MEYCFEELKRVVAVIKFLSAREVNEEKWGSPNNGNFMRVASEPIAEFDPFLREHLEKCKDGKVNIIYLFKSVSEELIEIMGKHVKDEVVNQINNLDIKHYSIIVDSTPDMPHVDQRSIGVRYCHSGKPYERFLAFLPRENHSAMIFYKITIYGGA
uniref:Uncharacterized protein n=1 Tax=Octopus bimaculoides TaxID=37653 RepID=A0A0L8GMH6_OCTBM